MMWKNTWGSHTHIHAEKLCFFLLLLVESEECGADITTKKKVTEQLSRNEPNMELDRKVDREKLSISSLKLFTMEMNQSMEIYAVFFFLLVFSRRFAKVA